jgi:hypothetical protein
MTALQRWPLLLLIYSNESVILGAKNNCDIIIPVSLVTGAGSCYVFQHLTTIKTV